MKYRQRQIRVKKDSYYSYYSYYHCLTRRLILFYYYHFNYNYMQLYLLVSLARNVDVKINLALFSTFCVMLLLQVSRARLQHARRLTFVKCSCLINRRILHINWKRLRVRERNMMYGRCVNNIFIIAARLAAIIRL